MWAQRTRVLLPISPERITYTAAEPVAVAGLIFTTPSHLALERMDRLAHLLTHSRGDHTHGGQRAVSDNTPEDVGTAAAGTHMPPRLAPTTCTAVRLRLPTPRCPMQAPRILAQPTPGTSDDVSRSDHVHESAGGGGGGAGLSDIAAEGVTETPSAGTGTDASRWDHEHDIPFNNTLEWDSNSQFGVRVEDVIEHLQEHIQYHTASGDYSSSGGATVGQVICH